MKIKILARILSSILPGILVMSCYQIREVTCSEAAEGYRSDSLNIVVNKSSNSAYRLELIGYDPTKRKNLRFRQQNYTWAQWFIADIAVGDTVVKKKDELKFYIHKKDTVLVFPFECDGKIYE